MVSSSPTNRNKYRGETCMQKTLHFLPINFGDSSPKHMLHDNSRHRCAASKLLYKSVLDQLIQRVRIEFDSLCSPSNVPTQSAFLLDSVLELSLSYACDCVLSECLTLTMVTLSPIPNMFFTILERFFLHSLASMLYKMGLRVPCNEYNV